MNSKQSFALRPGLATALGIFILAGSGPAAAEPSPSPSLSPRPAVSAPASTPLSKADARKLSQEFSKAQLTELKALRHRQSMERKELKASQKARKREWQNRENETRHKLFAEKQGREAYRAYFKDREERRKAMLKMMDDEKNLREKDQQARLKAVQDDQAAKKKEFGETLKRGERPAQHLWPQ